MVTFFVYLIVGVIVAFLACVVILGLLFLLGAIALPVLGLLKIIFGQRS